MIVLQEENHHVVKASNAGDLARYSLPAFKRLETKALDLVQQAVDAGLKIGVAFSCGKDSTVLLDLVRRVIPDVETAYYDSGNETDFDDNKILLEHYGIKCIKTERTLIDLMRYGGYWGYEHPVDPDAEVDFYAFLVGEPSYRWIKESGINCIALGLRAQESTARTMNAKKRGKLYQISGYDREVWHLCPLATWKDDDVWAYIAGRNLRYNTAYDRMAEAGFPRSSWRVGILTGISGMNIGRFSLIRMVAPEKFSALLKEFPKLWRYL